MEDEKEPAEDLEAEHSRILWGNSTGKGCEIHVLEELGEGQSGWSRVTEEKGVKRRSQCQLMQGLVDHDEKHKVNSKGKEGHWRS